MTDGGKPAEHPQPTRLLKIIEDERGSVTISHPPFETVFWKDEWDEIKRHCSSHSSSGQQDAGRQLSERLKKIRDMVDDTKDLSDTYRTKGISSCVQSELSEILQEIDALSRDIKDHDQQVAQREREKVLDELEQWTKENNVNYTDSDGDKLPAIVTGRILLKIESLRQQQGGAGGA